MRGLGLAVFFVFFVFFVSWLFSYFVSYWCFFNCRDLISYFVCCWCFCNFVSYFRLLLIGVC